MDDIRIIGQILERYLNDECTPDEIRSLLQYFRSGENEETLRKLICQHFETYDQADGPFHSQQEKQALLDSTFVDIKKAIVEDEKKSKAKIFYISARARSFAAASVLLILISGAAIVLTRQRHASPLAAKENAAQSGKDIAPGRDNAVLTLADGTTVALDSAANGTLTRQASSKVVKLNGQIVYFGSENGTTDEKPVYNSITTARGNQYQLILTDGTKVWLNASSSVRFPVHFIGNERRVEVTGEAYFEVARDARRPFVVAIAPVSGEANGTEIDVLGTHFNVNAYREEPDIRTTLLEGSVKVRKAGRAELLSPGQQARVTSAGITLKKDIDLSQVVAWKDGFFSFDSTDIRVLMRQVERWYDVDVDFKGKITEEGFSGTVSRNAPLSALLKALELNDVHIKRDGRKITVMP